jgi:general stress protein 26
MSDNNGTKTLSREEALKHLRGLVKEIDIAMLTTVDEDGTLRSRPMSNNGDIEFDGDLWFFTYGSSHKVQEAQKEPQVNVAFSQPGKQNYVSMSGRATLVRDKAKIEELWKPALKAWFPKGTDEPDIALLKVTVEKAEYWDAPSSLVSHVYSLVKAAVTGEPASPGDNQKIDLKG